MPLEKLIVASPLQDNESIQPDCVVSISYPVSLCSSIHPARRHGSPPRCADGLHGGRPTLSRLGRLPISLRRSEPLLLAVLRWLHMSDLVSFACEQIRWPRCGLNVISIDLRTTGASSRVSSLSPTPPRSQRVAMSGLFESYYRLIQRTFDQLRTWFPGSGHPLGGATRLLNVGETPALLTHTALACSANPSSRWPSLARYPRLACRWALTATAGCARRTSTRPIETFAGRGTCWVAYISETGLVRPGSEYGSRPHVSF